MADPIKFTEEELKQLKDLQSQYQTVIYNWGQIQIEYKLLKSREEEIESVYESLREKETQLMNSLNSKYGTGTLNLENGTFTPNS